MAKCPFCKNRFSIFSAGGPGHITCPECEQTLDIAGWCYVVLGIVMLTMVVVANSLFGSAGAVVAAIVQPWPVFLLVLRLEPGGPPSSLGDIMAGHGERDKDR